VTSRDFLPRFPALDEILGGTERNCGWKGVYINLCENPSLNKLSAFAIYGLGFCGCTCILAWEGIETYRNVTNRNQPVGLNWMQLGFSRRE
jgi:hypothetical protein